jgi:hypothetical protein
MNKRVFGTKLSSILNQPNQQMVLEKRKRKEKKVHKKEKKEKKLKKLQKEKDIIFKKVKGVKKLKKQAKTNKEEKVYDDILKELSQQYEKIFTEIQQLSSQTQTRPPFLRRRSSGRSFDFN